MTQEERIEYQEKARITRLNQIAFAEQNLRNDFADTQHWRDLAAKHGIRMPAWHVPGTDLRYMKRALRKIGKDSKWMTSCTGFNTLEEFATSNPKWPAFALIGLLLENLQ